MTTSSIKLDYRLLPCGCCFLVTSKGLPICRSADPVEDTALVLQEAGVADDKIVQMRLEGSDMGISFSLHDVLSESEYEPDPSPKSDRGSQTRH
jgi:hypothetical protein